MFDDSDKVGIDVVPLHGRPQSCMPNPVEGLLEDIVAVLLALEKIFAKDSSVEALLCSPAVKPSCSSAMILSACGFSMSGVILTMTLVAGEADRLVVLAQLQVACLKKCDEQGLGLQGWPFSCLPDLCCRLSS